MYQIEKIGTQKIKPDVRMARTGKQSREAGQTRKTEKIFQLEKIGQRKLKIDPRQDRFHPKGS